MKFGNTSQSLISVPNFFLIKDEKNLEIFKNKTFRKKYFREKDLFGKTKDLNICNNQRKNFRNFEKFNVEKYIPIHKLESTYHSNTNTNNIKGKGKGKESNRICSSDYSDTEESIVNKKSDYDKFTKYMHETNITLHTKGDLKEEIRNNIGNLIERINTKFDLDHWNRTDTQEEFKNRNLNVYTPLTLYNLTNENESVKFRNTLKDKVSSMMLINDKSKAHAINYLDKLNTESNVSKLQSPGYNQLPSINPDNNVTLIRKYDTKSMNETATLNKTLELEENKFKTTSLNDFRKRVWTKRSKCKIDDNLTINYDKYNCTKHRDPFCEKYNYNLNDGALKRFKLNSEMKQYFN